MLTLFLKLSSKDDQNFYILLENSQNLWKAISLTRPSLRNTGLSLDRQELKCKYYSIFVKNSTPDLFTL